MNGILRSGFSQLHSQKSQVKSTVAPLAPALESVGSHVARQSVIPPYPPPDVVGSIGPHPSRLCPASDVVSPISTLSHRTEPSPQYNAIESTAS